MTVFWAIVITFLLPDTPLRARFLSPSDRKIAIRRVSENKTGIKSNQFKWYQCKEALCDSTAWIIVLFHLCIGIPNGGIQSVGLIAKLYPTRLMLTSSQVWANNCQGVGVFNL